MNAESSSPDAAATSARTAEPLFGGAKRRVTVRDLAAAKARGEKWPMLTSYDALTAAVFDEAGIPVLLVGDSAGMVVFGHDSTLPVTVDDLLPLTAAVVRGTRRAMIIADLPFGSYQVSPADALAAATRFLKTGKKMLSTALDLHRPEGEIAEMFAALQKRYPDVPMGSYPFQKDGKPGTQLVLRCTDATRLAEAENELKVQLSTRGWL